MKNSEISNICYINYFKHTVDQTIKDNYEAARENIGPASSDTLR